VAAHRSAVESRAGDQRALETGLRADLERFSQVRCGLRDAARPPVQGRHPDQQPHQGPKIACVPRPPKPGRAAAFSGGQIPGIDQRGRQRPVPVRRDPVSVREQGEPVIDPVQQLRHAKRLHPRGGQLDGQRHPVQPRDQSPYQRPGATRQGEMGIDLEGPIREQHHGLRSLAVPGAVTSRQGQRRQPVPGLPAHGQRLPAGRQHPHIITGCQQPGAELRGRANHVLAIVQHQQQLPPGQRPRQRIGCRNAGLFRHSQRCGHRRRDLHRVAHR